MLLKIATIYGCPRGCTWVYLNSQLEQGSCHCYYIVTCPLLIETTQVLGYTGNAWNANQMQKNLPIVVVCARMWDVTSLPQQPVIDRKNPGLRLFLESGQWAQDDRQILGRANWKPAICTGAFQEISSALCTIFPETKGCTPSLNTNMPPDAE